MSHDLNTRQTEPSGCSCGLIVLTGLLALYQVGAALQAMRLTDEMVSVVSLSPPLEFVAGILWALIFIAAFFGLLQGRQRAVRFAGLSIIGFATYSALRLLLFARADYDRQRLPILLVTTALMLIIPAAYLLRPDFKSQRMEITDGDQPQAEREN
jgi:hypothetical protein